MACLPELEIERNGKCIDIRTGRETSSVPDSQEWTSPTMYPSGTPIDVQNTSITLPANPDGSPNTGSADTFEAEMAAVQHQVNEAQEAYEAYLAEQRLARQQAAFDAAQSAVEQALAEAVVPVLEAANSFERIITNQVIPGLTDIYNTLATISGDYSGQTSTSELAEYYSLWADYCNLNAFKPRAASQPWPSNGLLQNPDFIRNVTNSDGGVTGVLEDSAVCMSLYNISSWNDTSNFRKTTWRYAGSTLSPASADDTNPPEFRPPNIKFDGGIPESGYPHMWLDNLLMCLGQLNYLATQRSSFGTAFQQSQEGGSWSRELLELGASAVSPQRAEVLFKIWDLNHGHQKGVLGSDIDQIQQLGVDGECDTLTDDAKPFYAFYRHNYSVTRSTSPSANAECDNGRTGGAFLSVNAVLYTGGPFMATPEIGPQEQAGTPSSEPGGGCNSSTGAHLSYGYTNSKHNGSVFSPMISGDFGVWSLYGNAARCQHQADLMRDHHPDWANLLNGIGRTVKGWARQLGAHSDRIFQEHVAYLKSVCDAKVDIADAEDLHDDILEDIGEWFVGEGIDAAYVQAMENLDDLV
jgi:hypothetical protein